MRPGLIIFKLSGSNGRLFSIVLVQVFVCVHVFTESMMMNGVCGSLPCSEMEKAKGTLVECLLLEVSNSGY